MATEPPISNFEFHRAHTAAISALNTRRDAEVKAATDAINAANAGHAAATADVRQRHEAAQDARLVAFQRYAQDAFAQVVDDFERDPSRPQVAALAAVFEQVEAEAGRVLGRALTYELAQAMATQHLKSNPGGLQRLAHWLNWYDQGAGLSIAEATEKALKALRRKTDFGGMLAALIALEAQISKVAAPGGGQSCNGDAAARWDVMRFGGSTEAITAKLAELDAGTFIKRHGTAQERQAKFYEFEKPPPKPITFLEGVTKAVRSMGNPAPLARPDPPAPLPLGP